MLIPTTMPSTGNIFVCGACSAKFKYRKHLQRHSITRMFLQAISSMGRLIYMSVYQTPQRDLTSVSFAMLPSNEGLYLYGE
jgi:hypothetical protein